MGMEISAKPVSSEEILPWRDLYRQEMNCQIVHDSLHVRPGWTESWLLEKDGATVGYGSVIVGGPWTRSRTLYEFFLAPMHRAKLFGFFEALAAASQANAMNVQSNDALLAILLHAYASNISTEKIVFEDKLTTSHQLEGVALRRRGEPDNDWALEMDGFLVGTGGILYHYNRPYGDIYMNVAEPLRRRGFGTYIVQELKRLCYEGGSVPCARCDPDNFASRNTLQKAGFVPCAHILNGTLQTR
jgi:RimJ/RimL family protein N-acetyltransferase